MTRDERIAKGNRLREACEDELRRNDMGVQPVSVEAVLEYATFVHDLADQILARDSEPE